MAFFSDFQYGFRSSQSTGDPLTVVSDRIAKIFNSFGATRAVALDIYPRLLKEFGMLVFFTNLSLLEFQVRYLAFFLFSVIGDFWWFWMGNVHKNIQLMLEFLKATFLAPHFSYYSLMTSLMMLFVLFLSMLMIIPSTLNVIRHLICGNNENWLLNLNLIFETLWGRCALLISMLEKLNLFDWSNNTDAIDVKMDWSVLDEKSSFKVLELTFSSKLDWGSCMISIAKSASKKIGALISSMKFVSPEVALYLYKSVFRHENSKTVFMSGLVLLVAAWNC